MAVVNMVSRLLVIVGGLNWGLVGAAKFNLVETLLGSVPYAPEVVYILVGLAALVEVYRWATEK
jgi:uncharacterized protein